MSFDLGFWYSEGPTEAARGAEIYREILSGDSPVHANPAVENFHRDMVSVFPDLTEDNFERSPFSAPLHVSPAFVIAPISWSKKDLVSRALIALAKKHGLTCYDPQAKAILTSPEG